MNARLGCFRHRGRYRLCEQWSADAPQLSGVFLGRYFYRVEKWGRDGLRVELMLSAGNSLDKARLIFERATKHRHRIRLTIRQRMRVLDEWPRNETLL